ncbi:ABC transporter permease subunit [Ruania alba]|uniref:ABC-2 type transport system permease protein n=1 Tax=Ruania alba TaxID=648782 RepID=A0A1H5D8F0_9MICO|nr:ABC transporter permease subunit [Ruania alba]SED75010.1 ABC-2 type transport system permease protein [Ruania alba]
MLLRTELRRIRLRLLVWVLLIAGLLASLAIVLTSWAAAQPITDDQRAVAEEAYQQELADWEENGEEMVAQCLEDQERESERDGEDYDFGCDQMEPQPEWYLPYEATLAEHVAFTVRPFSILVLGSVGLAIGTTAVAAEFASGAMGTLLTFQPRRLRVYASKVGAVALLALLLSLLLTGILAVGTWGAFELRGVEATVSSALFWSAVRTLAVLPLAAVAGAVLGFLLRSTAVVLAVVAGYVIAVEAILVSAVRALTPWSVRGNLMSWLQYGSSYWVLTCEQRPDGAIACEEVERSISFAWSAGYLAVLAVLLVAVGALVFRQRDIT